MENGGTSGTNRKIAWFSAAGLALLAAVTVYALTHSTNMDLRGGEPAAAMPVPVGTALALVLETDLDARVAHAGDRFAARVVSPVRIAGTIVIPAGAEVTGHVALAEAPGTPDGTARLQLAYDTIRYGGRDYDLDTVSRIYESSSLAPGTRLEVSLDRAITVRPAATA